MGDASFELAQLDWRDLDNGPAAAIVDRRFDLVLVADCVYDAANAEALVQVLTSVFD